VYIPHKSGDTAPQLEPESWDNLVRGIPNFFEREVLYIENEEVLVWHPVTGEWELHPISRDCGSICPSIGDVKLNSGVWEKKKYHKLIFMGCHMTTGYVHILCIDAATGEYSLELFDRHAKHPFIGPAGEAQRMEFSQFQVMYMGKDEVLLFDGNTDQYQIYLVQPRLPTGKGVDPIGPFDPLEHGTFGLHENVIYLGNDHIMSYSPTTSEFVVYQYDRGAVDVESPFTRVLSSGNLEYGQQLTYFGDNQVVAWNPFDGSFKSFMVSADNGAPVQWPNGTIKYFGTGSLLGVACVDIKSCGSCLAKYGCGWCGLTHECMQGNIDGPCFTNCTNTWEINLCTGEPCNTMGGCAECLRDPFCGWCEDIGVCTEGSKESPLFGSCDYYKFTCPPYDNSNLNGGCHQQIK